MAYAPDDGAYCHMGVAMDHTADFTALGTALQGDTRIAVILADGTGHIRFWNAGAEQLFGHSAAEVAGQRIDIVVPPAYRDMHWAGFNRTIGAAWNGHDAFGPIEGLHKSGAAVELQVLLTPLRDAAGLVEAVLAIFRRAPGSPAT